MTAVGHGSQEKSMAGQGLPFRVPMPEPTASGMARAALQRRGVVRSQVVALPAPAMFDPGAMADRFPALWTRYLRDNFASPEHVADVFGLTPKGARKWWTGIGGCHADKLAMAARLHPAAVFALLFEAE